MYLVQSNLSTFEFNAAASEANLVFFDIQDDQYSGVDSLVNARGKVLQTAPVITMRIAAINDRRAEDIIVEARARRTADSLIRERGGPAADSLRKAEAAVRRGDTPAGDRAVPGGVEGEDRSTIGTGPRAKSREGKWFSSASPASDTGEVSFEKDVAEELRIKLGDIVTWNVQGVEIPSRVTSFREVTWERFEPNFFAVFSPASMRAAPKQHVILASVREAPSAQFNAI